MQLCLCEGNQSERRVWGWFESTEYCLPHMPAALCLMVHATRHVWSTERIRLEADKDIHTHKRKNRLGVFCLRWIWTWLHIRGRLKHLGVRCPPALPGFSCASQRPQYPLPMCYFGRSTGSTFAQKIKAWLAHLKVPLARCFYHFLSSSVTP